MNTTTNFIISLVASLLAASSSIIFTKLILDRLERKRKLERVAPIKQGFVNVFEGIISKAKSLNKNLEEFLNLTEYDTFIGPPEITENIESNFKFLKNDKKKMEDLINRYQSILYPEDMINFFKMENVLNETFKCLNSFYSEIEFNKEHGFSFDKRVLAKANKIIKPLKNLLEFTKEMLEYYSY